MGQKVQKTGQMRQSNIFTPPQKNDKVVFDHAHKGRFVLKH